MKIILFSITVLVSLYFCVGGIQSIFINKQFEEAANLPEKKVRFGDSVFRNEAEMKANFEYEKSQQYYGIYFRLGGVLSYIITVIAFGALGAFVKILSIHFFDKVSIYKQEVFLMVAFGGITGLVSIILNFVLPEFKYESSQQFFYYLVAFLSGLFTEEFILWLKNLTSKIFTTEHIFVKTKNKTEQ